MKGRMCTGREWVGGGFLQEGPSREESCQDQGGGGGDTLAKGLRGLVRLEAGAAVWERARDTAGQGGGPGVWTTWRNLVEGVASVASGTGEPWRALEQGWFLGRRRGPSECKSYLGHGQMGAESHWLVLVCFPTQCGLFFLMEEFSFTPSRRLKTDCGGLPETEALHIKVPHMADL